MREKYKEIMAAEEAFARRTALAVIVRRPVKPLLQLIPGMFIMDFLRRKSEIRRYSRWYLPPRRLALDAAWRIAGGEDKGSVLEGAEEGVGPWLAAEGLAGDEAKRALIALVHFLAEHHARLLQAPGETYQDLVRSAYGTLKDYQAFLSRLSVLERDYLQAVSRAAGAGEAERRLFEEQDAAEEQREKELETVFL